MTSARLGPGVFLAAAYLGHPYGRRPSPQSVQNVRRADLLTFLKARARPTGSTLVVAGDLTLAEARRLTLQWLGGWKGLAPAPLALPGPAAAPGGILLVHAGGVKEASIIIGSRTYSGADSGYLRRRRAGGDSWRYPDRQAPRGAQRRSHPGPLRPERHSCVRCGPECFRLARRCRFRLQTPP